MLFLLGEQNSCTRVFPEKKIIGLESERGKVKS